MNYTIYNTTTGQIERVIECPPELVSLQFDSVTHAALEGSFDDSGYYVEAGAPVAMPPKPTPHHVFDYATKQWIDPRTLQDFKDAKWAEIKQHRDAAENGGFDWGGSSFDSTPISQSRIQGAAQLATLAMINNQPFSIEWTLADNSVRTLNAEEMIDVGMVLGQHINNCHAKARLLRAKIESAQTKEEVEAIHWGMDLIPVTPEGE